MASQNPTLWRDWTLACLAGEILGIGAAGAAAAVLWLVVGDPATAAERWTAFAVLVGAGALEGLALGGFQWRVLRRPFPAVRSRAWVGATVAVAVAGWALGMLPSTLFAPSAPAEAFDPPLGVTAILATLAGAGAGLVFGAAQWAVLRRHVAGAARWVWANALGWALALAWIYIAASLPLASPIAIVGVGVAAGTLSGLSVGAVTGWAVVRLAREASQVSRPVRSSPSAAGRL